MGITVAVWQKELLANIQEKGIAAEIITAGSAFLLVMHQFPQLVMHLISLQNPFEPATLLQLQQDHHAKDILLVQLWEDIWLTRPAQVLSRISSMLGLNQTIHGRKTKVAAISQPEADTFLEQFHLQSSAKARHRYALLLDSEIVAVATFSGKRKMTRMAEDHTSVELIRFATKDGYTVQGGLSKLISHMVHSLRPSDVMTYADLDWSLGKGYSRLGFKCTAQLPPATLWLDKKTLRRYFPHRLPEQEKESPAEILPGQTQAAVAEADYYKIFNTGNLKYILYL